MIRGHQSATPSADNPPVMSAPTTPHPPTPPTPGRHRTGRHRAGYDPQPTSLPGKHRAPTRTRGAKRPAEASAVPTPPTTNPQPPVAEDSEDTQAAPIAPDSLTADADWMPTIPRLTFAPTLAATQAATRAVAPDTPRRQTGQGQPGAVESLHPLGVVRRRHRKVVAGVWVLVFAAMAISTGFIIEAAAPAPTMITVQATAPADADETATSIIDRYPGLTRSASRHPAQPTHNDTAGHFERQARIEKAERKKAARQARREARKEAKAQAALEAQQAREEAARLAAEEQAAREAQAQAEALTPGSLREIARTEMLNHFAADQWPYLDRLIAKESGWRVTAQNPTSGAYGLPQALPGTKMAAAGADWRTNPRTQVAWMCGYIRARYITPAGAWEHSQRVGWY